MGNYPSGSNSIQQTFSMLFNEDLYRLHSSRLEAYKEYWRYYLARHWSYFRDDGEPTITINYCRRMIDLHVNFSFKKAFEITIPDDPGTPENETNDRDFVRQQLEFIWKKNNKPLWILEAGQMGAITGDIFIRASWDPIGDDDGPVARADLIPSHLAFPEFGGPQGVDRKKLTRIAIVSPVFKLNNPEKITGKVFNRQLSGVDQAYTVELHIEVWTAATYNEDGTIKDPCTKQDFIDGEPVGPPEEQIIEEIPIIHIPNYIVAGEYYGISDLADIVNLNQHLNEKMTDMSDILNYHASPTTIIKGAKLKELEKGANRVWGVPAEATVENLELKGDMASSNRHIAELKDLILELTGTPQHALGNKVPSSNSTGISLQVQFMPLLEKHDVKIKLLSWGLVNLNRLLLKMTEYGNPEFGRKLRKLKGNIYRNDVIFEDPMPQDKRRNLEIAQARLGLKLSSRTMELEKMGYSQKEIEDIFKQIEEEELAAAKLNKKIMEISGIEKKEPPKEDKVKILERGGPDATRGEKIDNTLANKIND